MKSVLCALATLVLLAACSAPEMRHGPTKTYTMERLLKTVSVFGGSFSPDESQLLVTTNESGVFHPAILDISTGERVPVTEGEETTLGVAFFPQDTRLLFTRDTGGNEIQHLFLREEDGTVRELTEGEKTREVFAGFAHDLKSFFTLNNSRDPKFMDLYEWDLEALEPRLFYRNETGLDPGGLSPNKRYLALTKTNTSNDNDLYVLDLAAGGEPVLVSEHEGNATFSPRDFTLDGRHLYYSSNDGGEFSTLRRYDLERGTHEEVFATDWDVSFAYFTRNETYQIIGTNEDGYTKVRITKTETGERIDLPELPEGTVSGVGFSRSEELMRFYVSSDAMPGDLFVYNLVSGDLKRLTQNLDPEILAEDMVTSEVARFRARDGLEIPGPLYRPIGASAENKVPVLVWVHGGPGGQSRPGYHAEKQFLLNHGYGIFAVNNRGSSGYGKSFLAADDRRHGREPLWDCVDAKEFLKTLDWVDPNRIGIIGGSYGGYMVLAALAYQSEEFVVGVDEFGVANWVRTLESIPPWWESFREALYAEIGDPETDGEMLREISPVFHGERIRRPLLILQGANDPRVLKAESDDMVAAIRAAGGTVEYIVFDDEGHGFRKSENRIEGYERVLAFLDTYLKGRAAEG